MNLGIGNMLGAFQHARYRSKLKTPDLACMPQAHLHPRRPLRSSVESCTGSWRPPMGWRCAICCASLPTSATHGDCAQARGSSSRRGPSPTDTQGADDVRRRQRACQHARRHVAAAVSHVCCCEALSAASHAGAPRSCHTPSPACQPCSRASATRSSGRSTPSRAAPSCSSSTRSASFGPGSPRPTSSSTIVRTPVPPVQTLCRLLVALTTGSSCMSCTIPTKQPASRSCSSESLQVLSAGFLLAAYMLCHGLGCPGLPSYGC